ncbi:hypothetical protein DWW29_19010 [Bacteroides fragilis]|uniref:Uncharacterized protein n=1 Tax=Bacteroides fragilis (strain YCH46) TaxID=295405 RepID=Q64NX9_BACFR|nr:hypothetical protein F3B26_16480 [Bacteroides fragilis]BAD50803.1 hypothetical protein BF4061 [Bacteroides fragilis YCH46]RGK96834.1 hypothetical protein DXC86_23040 [Bacteroides fragilis]RGN96425.1 hypothetical protein DXB33_19420 [Bacteroides fragilis]RGO58544.1 hypothetical protein DXB09_16505 [Bacteroides fragilis]
MTTIFSISQSILFLDANNKSFAFKRLVSYHQKTCFNSVLKQVFYRQTIVYYNHLIYKRITGHINSFSEDFIYIFYKEIITILTSRISPCPKSRQQKTD